jgi:molybdate transport system substrate-binding protein
VRGMLKCVLVACLSILLGGARVHSQEIMVAAAADLKFAMGELAANFEKQTGNKVNVTYGSSGNFFSQIQNGAPFDLFFSADVDYARKLEAGGQAEPGTLYSYAVGRIVIWMPPGVKVDLNSQGMGALLDSAIQKIAIANPAHAPYGRAAVAAMKKAGVYEKAEPKLVYGDNISQAAQFAQSGNAQAGIIALSLAISPAMKDSGKMWLIPEELHPAIEQAAMVVKSSQKKEAAKAFLEYVKSAEGKAVMDKYGFTTPPAGDAKAKAA